MQNWLKDFWRSWIAPMACLIVGHNWRYSYMRKLDGRLARYRHCARCEHTDQVVE